MSITVYPYKLTQRELEARLEPGLTVLPGQYLRFATAEPIFGQVREVRALPPSSPGLMGGYRLLIDLLYGTPSLSPQQVVLMNAAQMGHEIQRLQEPISQPLRLSPDFSAELLRLGALTIIGGDDFVQKYEVLQLLIGAIQPHRRLVILDPLGVFAPEDGYAVLQAGRDVRLSLQAVGSKSFLDTLGELFAPGLREAALRIVADHLPPMNEFSGFQGVLDWYSALNVSLKNLIVQNLQSVTRSQVFADTPEQVLDWNRAAQHPVTVLNLSTLQEPWRGLFFRESMQSLLMQSGEDVVPVLLYPENYLPNLPQWIQKADESEFKLLMLASPYVDEALLAMANNRLWVDTPDKISLVGSLTLGLPLVLPSLNALATAGEQLTEERALSGSVLSNEGQGPVGLYTGLSSFNVPIEEGDFQPAPTDFLASEMEPPLHWLGEAAEPMEWAEPEPPAAVPSSEQVIPTGESHGELLFQGELPEEPVPVEPSEWPVMPETQPSSDLDAAMPLPPVVDLAAPPPEPAPEFLSADQLSQLLGSGSSNPQMMASTLPGSVAPTPMINLPEPEVPVIATPEPMVHQTPEEAHQPEYMPAFEPIEPASPEPALPAEPELLSADHFPTWEAAESASEPLLEPAPTLVTQPSHAPFPTPEEYEREEFHFDLNPDAATAYAPSLSESDQAHTQPETLASSLDEFASFDIPIEPLREAAPTGSHPSGPQAFWGDEAPVRAEAATFVPAAGQQEGSSILSGIAATDQELHETLDLIFPNYPHTGQQAGEVSPEAAAIPAPAVMDEPMAIVQKYIEPPHAEAAAFKAGDRVKHPAYGAGVVQKVIPTEESVVLNISFETVGKRLLDPALCELTREAAS